MIIIMKSNVAKIMIAMWGTLIAVCPRPLFPQAKNPKGLTPDQVAAIHGRKVQSEEPGAIPAALERERGDVYIHAPSVVMEEIRLDPKNQLSNWMRHCDLIAVGKIGASTPYITARKGFVNTDWDFELKEVLKNNPEAPVSPGEGITVIAFGGRLKIGQRTVHAIQTTYREFKLGEEYLLFLKFVPETGAYSLIWPFGYGFSGMRVFPLAKQPNIQSEIEAMDRETLIRTAKQVTQ